MGTSYVVHSKNSAEIIIDEQSSKFDFIIEAGDASVPELLTSDELIKLGLRILQVASYWDFDQTISQTENALKQQFMVTL